ncbi:MAG TPA: hypothetical protein VLS27_07715 [Gammaproteobacteria bacterium]|nr:hypothetical protein [Gammaproteobacteria bacterium]
MCAGFASATFSFATTAMTSPPRSLKMVVPTTRQLPGEQDVMTLIEVNTTTGRHGIPAYEDAVTSIAEGDVADDG